MGGDAGIWGAIPSGFAFPIWKGKRNLKLPGEESKELPKLLVPEDEFRSRGRPCPRRRAVRTAIPTALPTQTQPASSPPFTSGGSSNLLFSSLGDSSGSRRAEGRWKAPSQGGERAAEPRVLALLSRCPLAHPPDALSPLRWDRDTALRSIGKTWGLPFRPSTLIPVRAKPKPNTPPEPTPPPPAVAPPMTTLGARDHRERPAGLERPHPPPHPRGGALIPGSVSPRRASWRLCLRRLRRCGWSVLNWLLEMAVNRVVSHKPTWKW